MGDFSCLAIITGTLAEKPRADTTKSGKTCAKFAISTDGGRVFALALEPVATDVLALSPGDAIACTGKLSAVPRLYRDEPSITLNLFVTRVMTAGKSTKRKAPEGRCTPADFPEEAGDLEELPF